MSSPFASPLPGDISALYNAIDAKLLHLSCQRTGTQDSADLLIQQIDSEMDTLHKVISALVLRRNRLTSISRLPDDVLTYMLETFCASEDWNPNKGTSILVRVCRRWHDILLRTPSVWSHIDDKWSAAVPVLLTRSRSTPLSIEWSTSNMRSLPQLELALDSMERVRTLSVGFSPRAFRSLEPWLERSAGLLQSADLRTSNGQSPLASSLVTLPLLPSSSVRSITLDRFVIPWRESANRWPSLTSLAITNLPKRERLTLMTLLSMLMELPALEDLRLYSAIGLDDSVKMENLVPQSNAGRNRLPSKIQLNSLQSLDVGVEDNGNFVLQFCKHVFLPSASDFNVLFDGLTSMDHLPALRIIPSFRDELPIILSGAPDSIRLAGMELSFLSLTAESVADPHWEFTFEIGDGLHDSLTSKRYLGVLQGFLQSFDLTETRSLHVGVVMTADEWNEYFGFGKQLQSISFEESEAALPFVNLLRPTISSELMFPSLKTIDISDCRFEKEQSRAFADVLRERQLAGHGLRTIFICSYDPEESEGSDWSGVADVVHLTPWYT